jgi:hypothetical protein
MDAAEIVKSALLASEEDEAAYPSREKRVALAIEILKIAWGTK